MRTWTDRALAVCTFVGALIAVAQVSSTVRKSTLHWVRLHPGWTLTISLAFVLVSLLLALALHDRDQRVLAGKDLELERLRSEMTDLTEEHTAIVARVNERTVERDRHVYATIRAHLTRVSIRWIAEHDFGGSWEGKRVYPFYDIEYRLDPLQCRFASPDLEELREALIAAVQRFGHALAIESGPAKGREGIYNVMDPDDINRNPKGEQIAKKRARILNEAADRVVAAYDDLVSAAQKHGIYD